MPKRSSTATVDVGLRVRERLRAQVQRAAKANNQSMNAEIVSRLQKSFEKDQIRDLGAISEDLKNVWARYGEAFLGHHLRGDLLRAAEALVAKLGALPPNLLERSGIEAAAAKVKEVANAIDLQDASVIRHLHTTREE